MPKSPEHAPWFLDGVSTCTPYPHKMMPPQLQAGLQLITSINYFDIFRHMTYVYDEPKRSWSYQLL